MSDNFDPVSKIRLIHGLLRKEMDELLKVIERSRKEMRESPSPPMDVLERGNELVAYLELPGLCTDDFTVYQHEDLIIIEGVRCKSESTNEKINYLRTERDLSNFKRLLKLPFGVNDESITAKIKDGVLEIRMEKTGTDKIIEVKD